MGACEVIKALLLLLFIFAVLDFGTYLGTVFATSVNDGSNHAAY